MKRLISTLALGAAPALAISSAASAVPVTLQNFNSPGAQQTDPSIPFFLDAIYGSWGAPFATLTSAPDRFIVRSHNYGSAYKYLGGEFNANGNDTLQLEVTVSEGTAGCLVDLVDANNNGIAFRFYGLIPGNGTNGTNEYTLRMKLSDAEFFTGSGVLDTTRISQMHIEIDPGPTSDFYTASFNDLSLISSVVAASNWTGNTDNAWSVGGNWTGGGVPNTVDATANFGAISSGQFNVNVDGGNKTVGTINFDNATSYTIGTGGGNGLTLEVSTGTAAANAVSGSHTIAAPLTLNSDTIVTVTPAASTLTASSLQPTTHAITKSGAGNFAANNVRASALTVSSGTVTVLANGGDAGTSKVAALTLAGGTTPTATLDLNNNDLVVGSATPKATIEAQVKNARNNGLWNQPGITSSNARVQANGNTGLGVLSGAEYTSVGGTGTFSGQAYTATDTLVKYTWNGDANFSGTVNFDDYVKIDVGFNTNLTGWLNGDFNYSGSVNFDDYVLIDVAFNTQSGTLGRAVRYLSGDDRSDNGLGDPGLQEVIQHFDQFGLPYANAFLAAVPEPTTLALLGMPALTGMTRRRRRQ